MLGACIDYSRTRAQWECDESTANPVRPIYIPVYMNSTLIY